VEKLRALLIEVSRSSRLYWIDDQPLLSDPVSLVHYAYFLELRWQQPSKYHRNPAQGGNIAREQ
jgi:hypothetical protein